MVILRILMFLEIMELLIMKAYHIRIHSKGLLLKLSWLKLNKTNNSNQKDYI